MAKAIASGRATTPTTAPENDIPRSPVFAPEQSGNPGFRIAIMDV